jgi:hypothetical protein
MISIECGELRLVGTCPLGEAWRVLWSQQSKLIYVVLR